MKKIPSYILKSILFFLPFIVIWIYTWTCPLCYYDDELPNYVWNREFTRTDHHGKYGVIILGDSTANAVYNPLELSEGTVNLALGGSATAENYYVLKEWLEYNEAPHDIFISFYDLNLMGTENFYVRQMASHRFGPKTNWEIIQKGREYGNDVIAPDDWFSSFVSYECRLPNKYIYQVGRSIYHEFRLKRNLETIAETDKYRGKYIAMGEIPYNDAETTLEGFEIQDVCVYYWYQLLDLCRDNDIQVHIIKPHQPNFIHYSPEYENDVRTLYEGMASQYPNVEFVWDIDPSYTGDLFSDPIHANLLGAAKFAQELKEKYPDVFAE